MRTRAISAFGRPVSAVVLGTDHMGGSIPAGEAARIIERYLESGGNTLDTARCYGSEDLVGRVLRGIRAPERPMVMTKGGREIEPEGTFLARAREDFWVSCDTLGFVPDLWFLHRDCPSIPVDEVVGFCREFLGGCPLGLSNWAPGRFRETLALEGAPVVSEIQFSLAPSTPALHGDPTLVCMDKENEEFYERTRIPVMAFSSQAKGYFSKLLSSVPLSPKAQRRFDSPLARSRARRVGILARRLDVPPAAIAVAYLACRPGFPVFPIVAASRLPQLEESILGGSVELGPQDIRFLEGEEGEAGFGEAGRGEPLAGGPRPVNEETGASGRLDADGRTSWPTE